MRTKMTDNLKYATNLIQFLGLGYKSSPLRCMIFCYIIIPTNMIMIGMVMYMIWYSHGDIILVASGIESFSSLGQVLLRKMTLFVHQRLIWEMLNDRKSFWDYNVFGTDLGRALRRKISIYITLIKILQAVVFGTVGCMIWLTFAVDNMDLPQPCWIPATETVVIVGAFEGLFVIMCLELIVQFKLLNKAIQNLQFKAFMSDQEERLCLKQLKSIVDHHNFLDNMHKKLTKTLSTYFLFQCGITVMGICIQFYIVLYNSATGDRKLKALVYLICVSLQLALIFFPISFLQEETEKLHLSVYVTNWEVTDNLKIRRHLIIIMMKARTALTMSAGGLFTVNRNQFLQIFRLSFSAATLLGQLQQ